jgi:hypothetical protein
MGGLEIPRRRAAFGLFSRAEQPFGDEFLNPSPSVRRRNRRIEAEAWEQRSENTAHRMAPEAMILGPDSLKLTIGTLSVVVVVVLLLLLLQCGDQMRSTERLLGLEEVRTLLTELIYACVLQHW